jgi:4-amino-4-deoxy-L-arabinose transferase-like glycosyltransferase
LKIDNGTETPSTNKEEYKQGRTVSSGKAHSKKTQTVVLALLFFVLLTLLLRVINIGHPLSWDEAFDTLTTAEHSTATANSLWGDRFYQHSPLYLETGVIFEKVTHAKRQNLALFFEMLSILCSLITVLLIYLCGKEWFTDRVGILGAFFYAILPAARVFDSWIKQDSMMMMFALAFLFFFFRKRYIISGIFLGLAVLTKEPTIFIAVAVGVFLIVSGRFKEILKLLLASSIAAVISLWWFVFYASSSGRFIDFFLGNSSEAKTFANSWYHFIARIPQDVGWVVLILCIAAIGLFIYRFKKEKRGMVPFLFIWIVVLYLIFSISYGKPPWVIHSVLPPLALLAGWALSEGADLIRNKRLALGMIALVLVLALVLSVLVGFNSYLTKADRSFSGWLQEKKMAEFINTSDGNRVMLRYDDISPVLFYYLNAFSPEKVAFAGAQVPPDATSADTVFLIDPATDFSLFTQRILHILPDFLILRSAPMVVGVTPGQPFDRETLIRDLEQYDKNPRTFGNAFVFNGGKIAGAAAAQERSQ